MKHGGDILTYSHLYDGRIIDFSSNINPLGPPEGLKDEIIKGFDAVSAYPDIKYRELKKEISKYLGCDVSEVLVGNGAVEIINNIAMLFDRTVVTTPCFMEYIKRPEAMGREVLKIRLAEDFFLKASDIVDSIKSGDLVILGNPNNPTGRRIEKDVLMEIHEKVASLGAFLLLDEAFYEFCPPDYDSVKLLYGSSNLCVIRAATKFFALPGIRLGYAYASREIVERLQEIELPWSINIFADIAGRTIFKQVNYKDKSKEYIAEQREYMLRSLKEIKSIKAFESQCNFILIKLLNDIEDNIFDFMIKRGIMIRKASSFEGLDKSYIRIAVKDYESNSYLIDCLKEYEACRR